MFTRLAYFIIVLGIGIGTIVLCRLTQLPIVEGASSWLTAPVQVVVGYPVRAVTEIYQNIQGISDLRRENARLQAEVDQLHQQVVQLPEIQRENAALREQLDLRRSQPSFQWTTGRIIGRDPNPLIRAVIIDLGSRDGVADGMTVMTSQGLVGRILRASTNTSKVLLITDASSSVNGQVQSSRARGVLSGSPAGYLTMQYIGQAETVHSADKVVTSGLGGTFPAGLLVGNVIDVRQKDVDMFQEAHVEPAVGFDRLEIVLVITNFLPTKLE